MKNVSLLIKPASGLCNLRCKYCFYRELSRDRENALMSEETLETVVRRAFEASPQRVSFAFQGGEPTLAGLDFFRVFIRLKNKYAAPGSQVQLSIQTNGLLIDEAWADFFKENDFLVGLSVDGDGALHDANRLDSQGKGSYQRVLKAYKLMTSKGVRVNILCVVTGAAARRGQSIYQSLKKLGCQYIQFIPCLDPLEEGRGSRPWSLTPEKYGKFLKTVFDLWYRDWEGGNYTSIRLFDDYVHLTAGMSASACATCGQCGRYFVVEWDGNVYPCDFFVTEEHRLGNILTDSLDTLSQSPAQAEFLEGNGYIPRFCLECPYIRLCHGGCKRDRVGVDGGGNYYCSALREFFDYAMPRLRNMANLERQAAMGGRSR